MSSPDPMPAPATGRFLSAVHHFPLRIYGGSGGYAATDLQTRYRRPARLDDDLMVVSRVVDVRAASCAIHQSVMRGDEELTDATITVAWLTPQGRPQRQPRAWTDIYTRLCQGEDIHP